MDPVWTQRLRARRASVHEMLRIQTRDIDRIVAASRLVSSDDEHDPEGATIAFERAQALAVADQLRAQLADLDLALARVASGTYGVCDVCHRDIAPERLEARPTAVRCIGCASRLR